VRSGPIITTTEEVPIADNAPDTYIVKRGDTLWDISAMFLRDPWFWPGWRIRPLARIGAYRRFVFMPEYDMWAEKICHIYLCRAGRRTAPPIEPDHKPVWLDIEAAGAALSVDGDRAMFAAAIAYLR
ncbi:MAG: LysM peptidoglycan-binding domain-containing protein, partial [Pseudomonadota bacterium]